MLNMESLTGGTPKSREPEQMEGFLLETEKAVRNATEEYKTKNELSLETRNRLHREAEFLINSLTHKPDEKKAIATAKLLAKMYALPGNPVDQEIIALHTDMQWGQWGIADNLLKDQKDLSTKRANLVSREILRYFQLDPERTMAAWREAVFPMKTKIGKGNLSNLAQLELVFENLMQLRKLERARPASASLLSKEFGIMNFGRYPLEILVAQYDHREDIEHPYGVVVSGRRDYNGAFFQRSDKTNLKSLFDQLQENYRLRVVESGGKFSLVRSFIRLNERYGAKQKISFALVSAHGSKRGFSLGDWSISKRSITSVDMGDLVKAKEETLKKMRELFTDHATIIFNSCSTGKKFGVAQKIFERLGIKVLASPKNGNIKSILVKNDRNKLEFDVKYSTQSLFFPTVKARKYS